ncbi:hypothetical protein GPECTOR_140g684 [Gonium pectorale]|uniref:Uncharacterized protein n=1 Tax=Gonium pectorale TaxID=33097 RepID=A0A150FY41_GONPE|nr:hypothetical protein GPECTOR_140g684 [Gonium pectorale]|eukprot:KXZ42508.1 hypothetical protein GPECTOR_140g684 [Gonium pectorale]
MVLSLPALLMKLGRTTTEILLHSFSTYVCKGAIEHAKNCLGLVEPGWTEKSLDEQIGLAQKYAAMVPQPAGDTVGCGWNPEQKAWEGLIK